MIPPFKQIYSTIKHRYDGVLLSFDPGHTTGYVVARIVDGEFHILEAGQLETDTVEKGFKEYKRVIEQWTPQRVVFEDYRIYGWKTDQHSFSEVLTIRLIGILETLCMMQNVKTAKQMAQIAKQFSTDDKLKEWNLWQKGQRHARDAIRHALYWFLFTYPKIIKEESKIKIKIKDNKNY